MARSFRLRLALFSAMLAGLALAGFAGAAWWLARDARVDLMDAEIRAWVQREALPRARPPQRWQKMLTELGEKFANGDSAKVMFLAADGTGLVLFRTAGAASGFDVDRLPWPPKPAGPPEAPRGEHQFAPPLRSPPKVTLTTLEMGGKPWRVGLVSLPDSRLALAVETAVIDAEMAPLRRAFLIAVPLVLALVGLGAWLLAGRALRPVRMLTASIQRITASGLDQRIAVAGQDREFEQLLAVFNEMLGRLERSFAQASRFSADAAHELKTPLAILQGQIERAIGQAEDGSPMQAALTGILDEVRRLSTISGKLLLLSRADAGRLRLRPEPFDLSGALEELAEDARMLAPTLHISQHVAAGLTVQADAALLRQVLHNLLSNAIKYNVPDGWVKIAAAGTGDMIDVTLSNASTGLSAADREHIFERFFRADRAHGRQIDGVGLGLSVSREIARAHGGELVLSMSLGNETHFRLTLPREATV